MTPRALASAALISVLLAGQQLAAQEPGEKPKPESAAPAAGDKEAAPAVRIVSVDTRSTGRGETAEVCVSAEDRGGGVAKVELAVDGSKMSARTRRVVAETGEECPASSWLFDVNLLPGSNNLEATAYASNGTASQPARNTVVGTSPLANTTLHILTVGIETYRGDAPALTYAEDDARAFADSLSKQAQPLFSRVRVISIFNAAATKDSIAETFLELASGTDSVGPNDTFVFFFAGHGAVANVGAAQSFFLASAGVTRLGEGKDLARNGISASDLLGWLNRISAGSKLLVLDACNSGAMIQYFNGKDGMGSTVLDALQKASQTAILAATQPSEPARASGALGHGLFTAALLQNDPEPGERRAVHKINDLVSAAREVLPILSKRYGVADQEPWMMPAARDFPLVIR